MYGKDSRGELTPHGEGLVLQHCWRGSTPPGPDPVAAAGGVDHRVRKRLVLSPESWFCLQAVPGELVLSPESWFCLYGMALLLLCLYISSRE